MSKTIKTERDLDTALEAQGTKERRNSKRQLQFQIVGFVILVIIGMMLIFPGIFGLEYEGVLLYVYRIAGILYTLWALAGLFVSIDRYRRQAWDWVSSRDLRFHIGQSVTGLIALNLILFGPGLAGYIERGAFDASSLVFFLGIFLLVNWFLLRIYRREYAKLLRTGRRGPHAL